MEDYKIIFGDQQIEIHFQSSHAKEESVLFTEFDDKRCKIAQEECCILRDNIFVITKFGNARQSGFSTNMTMLKFRKRELKGEYWIIYVKKHKNFYVSGHMHWFP